MKKILLVLLIITLTGCSPHETSVTNPNGNSKTYKFFKQKNYNHNQYTLILTNDSQKITIIKKDKQIYYELSSNKVKQIIIEKEGKKYTLNNDNKTYTIEDIVNYDDFAKGYLPESLNSLKNKKYKKATIFNFLSKYVYEKYTYSEGETIYYFKRNKLVKIENKTPLTKNKVKVINLSTKVDKSKFNVPKEYQEIIY
ncbi:MAG: hypothetical protein IJ093_00185 [Bacilli bacterium]|nr:hypothetical protein [Bacilli bacterium]